MNIEIKRLSPELNINIIKTESEFPSIFTNRLEKPYGIFFFNEGNKESHDSNHAVVFKNKIDNLDRVLGEIKEFYMSKGLTPRLYQTFNDGYFDENRAIFEKYNFNIIHHGINKIFLLCNENKIAVKHNLKIERITEWDEEIQSYIFTLDDDNFSKTVIQNSLLDENYYLFVGYLNNHPVSIGAFWVSPYGYARLDNVETAKNQRGKGFSRAVIGTIADYVNKNLNVKLYEWPANETAERIYIEAGFTYIGSTEGTSAVYGDKL